MAVLLLLHLLLLPVSLAASPCNVKPFEIPIKDVQVVSSIPDSIMRGIPATIGNPPQNIVLLPWAELNNTWVYDEQDFCDRAIIFSDTICEVRRGNFFREYESTSWREENSIRAAGGALIENPNPHTEGRNGKLVTGSIGGRETFNVASTGDLADFPIGIPRIKWDFGYTILHAIGLGSNSTYLNALRASDRIGSRVWSMWWGRLFTANPLDGSVVLGGYDKNKVMGNNHTQALDFSESTGCWTGMWVTITDITLNFRDGENRPLLKSSTALQCCIVPQRQLLLEAPTDIFNHFVELTDSKDVGISAGLHWMALTGSNKTTAYDGDITFRLNSGLEVRVPNDQFVVPNVYIERNGSRMISDDGKRDILIGDVQARIATLGRYFFTSAYLMVNHEVNTFTLWQANATSESDLVSVSDEKVAKQCGNDAAGSETTTPPLSTAEKPVSTGVIAGAVVGGVALIAIVVGIIIFFRRRQCSKTESKITEQVQPDQSQYQEGTYLEGGYQEERATELPSSKTMRWDGSTNNIYEMPSEARTENPKGQF